MKSEKPRPRARGPRPEIFRKAIEAAAAEGLAPGDMVLHLTLRDAHLLKTDRAIPVQDVSFADGGMSFLGVPVVQGGVAVSFLGGDGRDDVAFTI
ncbi:MAG: hypothetical protein ABSD80_14385 [Caulobacteraceae bacterium]|jgi:hypothetical protein